MLLPDTNAANLLIRFAAVVSHPHRVVSAGTNKFKIGAAAVAIEFFRVAAELEKSDIVLLYSAEYWT